MSLPHPHQSRPEDLPRAEIEARRRQREINQPAIDLLRSWAVGTPEEIAEQRDALDYLVRALDEDRTEGNKLFP